MPFMSVIQFWFEETRPAQWWKKSTEFDALIRDPGAVAPLDGWQKSLFSINFLAISTATSPRPLPTTA